MAHRPRLKPILVHRSGSDLVIFPKALERVHLVDETGGVATLLQLLSQGRYAVPDLRTAMADHGVSVTDDEIAAVLSSLDRLGVLEASTEDEAHLDPATRARHESNLRFYDLFTTLDRTSADFHRRVTGARILLLGAGGLGSGILQSLVGLGVGEVTLVDDDTVEVKNLARQFAYNLAAVGRPKVAAAHDWAAAYSTGTTVLPVARRATDAASIRDLATGRDLVICAADTPLDIHLIVNEACTDLGIPFVAGGLAYSTLSYYSVWPGHTPCRHCLETYRRSELDRAPDVLRGDPFIPMAEVNRATGPVVQIISGLMAMEAMRYVTRTDPPVAAATYRVIELADGMATSASAWERHPDCPMCPKAASPAGDGGRP